MRRRLALASSLAALSLALLAAPVAAGPWDTPAAGRPSNMGVCSSFLAQLGVRAEVNHLIQQNPIFGLTSPGALYSVRAREHPAATATPEQECVQRPH